MTSIFIACKKNNDKKAVCRISTIKPVMSGEPDEVTYDQQGRVSRIVSGFFANIYTYDGDSIIITNVDTTRIGNITRVKNNSLGLAVNIRSERDGGSTWFNSANEYDGDKLIRTTSTSSDQTPPAVTTYLWSPEHNMIAAISGTDTTKFDYYLDKPSQPGDFLLLTQLIGGYETYRNKNLLRSYSGTTFTYDFLDNKIATLRAASANSITLIDFEYLCN